MRGGTMSVSIDTVLRGIIAAVLVIALFNGWG